MGLFDGLIARIDGAVTSAEAVAAGLFHTTEAKSPVAPASSQFVWQGPLQPGKTAPPMRAALPTTAAAPSPSAFNMFGGDPMGGLAKVLDFSSWLPSSGSILTSAPKDYAVESGEWAKDLRGWDLSLSSADKFMNAKDGATDLSAKITTWRNGIYQDAQSKLSALVTGQASAYDAAKRLHDEAVSQATDLQQETQDRWAKFSSSGITGWEVAGAVARVTPLAAPLALYDAVKAAPAAYQGVKDSAGRAVDAVERAVAPAVDSLNTFVKYAPWVAGALGAAYVFSLLPKPRDN